MSSPPPTPAPEQPRAGSDLLWASAALLVIWQYAMLFGVASGNHLPFLPPDGLGFLHRSILEGAVFVGLLLWILPERLRARAGTAALIALLVFTAIHLGWTVAERSPRHHFDDRAEMITLALERLLHGLNPYEGVTSLGGPFSVLTTSLALGLPGHLLFNRPEVMNLLMLPLALGMLAILRRRANSPMPLALLALTLFLSPPVVWELVWKRDLMWGSVLVLCATVLLERGHLRPACLVFTLGVCTRTGLFFLFPLWSAFLLRHHRDRAAGPILLAIALGLALELPFVLWDPNVFFFTAPIGITTSKFSQAAIEHTTWLGDAFAALLPTGSSRLSIIIAAVFAVAGWLGWRAADVAQLSISMALIFGLLFLSLGGYYRFEYLIWMFIPLLTALAAAPGKSLAPPEPRRV